MIFIAIKPLLNPFNVYSTAVPSNSGKKFVRALTFESIVKEWNYIIYLVFLTYYLYCLLFLCNNPISFTAIYGIINTWKTEYTFFLVSDKPFFAAAHVVAAAAVVTDVVAAAIVATVYDHICTQTVGSFVIHLTVNCNSWLSNEFQLTFFFVAGGFFNFQGMELQKPTRKRYVIVYLPS